MQDTLILPMSREPEISARPAIETFPVEAGEFRFLEARRILLPFDLSRTSVCSLRAATDFAEKTGAAIHLLHVIRPVDPVALATPATQAEDNIAEAAERLLKHWVKRVVQGRVQTYVSIRIGDPVDVIVARALATRADLIVMTSRSSGGLSPEARRSAAERVSRAAHCPVLTIPEKCANEIAYSVDGFPASNWRAVLLPVDFSKAAEHGLKLAAELAEQKGAKLILAHGAVVEGPDDETRIRKELMEWSAGFAVDIPTEYVVWPGGNSLYAILSEAARSEASLIVLPARAQSWARRLRAGSITDGVLRQAPCPVLMVNEHYPPIET